jgi:hypothetical protein
MGQRLEADVVMIGHRDEGRVGVEREIVTHVVR